MAGPTNDRVLTEASLSRVYGQWLGSGFAVLTSWRQKASQTENERNFAALKSALQGAGFGWIPLAGRWREIETGTLAEEPSLLVPATKRNGKPEPEGLRTLVIALGHLYSQDFVVWSAPGGNHTELLDTSTATGSVAKVFTTFRPTDLNSVFSSVKNKASFYFEHVAPPSGWAAALGRSVSGEIRSSTPPG